jgi:hypothetical protein
MPVKFKPSVPVRNAERKTIAYQGFYMRSTPLEQLMSSLNASNTSPKQKQKIRNELVRRGK